MSYLSEQVSKAPFTRDV